MNKLGNFDSTIDDNMFNQDKYFSELNIDNDIPSKEVITEADTKGNLEENRLESFSEDSSSEECTALVTIKEHRLMVAQTMFKKSIKVSIKSFLISLSLSFLNLFI